MPKKVKVKLSTSLIGVYEVFDSENDKQADILRPQDVPNTTSRKNLVWLAHLDACWWVHQDPSHGEAWWGFSSRPCPADPIFKVKLGPDGKISSVEHKVGSETWVALRPMTRPAGVALETVVEIRDDDTVMAKKRKPKMKIMAGCRYVIVGGRAYKVC